MSPSKRATQRSLASVKTSAAIEKANTNAQLFVALLRREGLPVPHREHMGIDGRRFRFDFAWPEWMVCLESEGGTWSGGRHTRGSGYASDCVKYSEAAVQGWLVLRVPASALCTEMTLSYVRRAIARRQEECRRAPG